MLYDLRPLVPSCGLTLSHPAARCTSPPGSTAYPRAVPPRQPRPPSLPNCRASSSCLVARHPIPPPTIMFGIVVTNVFAFVPPQDGSSTPAGSTPVHNLAGLRYVAEMTTRPLGPRGRPLSPPPRRGATHPGGMPLLDQVQYGLGVVNPSQRAYELSPTMAQLHAEVERAAPATTLAARDGARGIAGASVPGGFLPNSNRVLGSPDAPDHVAMTSLPWMRSPEIPGPAGGGDSMDDGADGTPGAGPSTGVPRPMAGAVVSLPTPPPRRARPPQCRPPAGSSPSRRQSKSPSPTRARRASPSRTGSPAAGAFGAATTAAGSSSPRVARSCPAARLAASSSGADDTMAAQVAALSRSSVLGFSGLRREMTAQRKELAIMNNQQRMLIKKVDGIAVLADRLNSALMFQRKALHDLSVGVGKVMAEVRSTSAPAAGARPLESVAGAVEQPQSHANVVVQDAQWIIQLRAHINEYLTTTFTQPGNAADVWPTTQHFNELSQSWTASRLNVDLSAARALLERRWRLPQRPRRSSTGAQESGAAPAPALVRPNTTMGFRYVNRAVSHFYQKLGNKAVAAFLTVINDEKQIGSLRRLRGTQTKYEVVLSPAEAAPLIVDDAFLTDFTFHAAVVRALTVVFSTLGVLRQFSEDATVTGGRRVLACRTAHLALITMKIRQHIKMRATTNAGDEEEAVVAVPGLNAGHRAEWVEELSTVCTVFSAQGDRACNGLRLTDGKDTHRADPVYRTPRGNANAAAAVGRASPAAAAGEDAADAAATLAAWGVISNDDDDEASNGGRDVEDDDLDAAVEAAHAAVRRSLEEESVD